MRRVLALLAFLAACRTSTMDDAIVSELPGASLASPPSSPSACATMRPLDGDDVVAVDGNALYFLSREHGLVAFDVSNVEEPRVVARAPLRGLPIALVVRRGVAVAVMARAVDAKGALVGSRLYAVDARGPSLRVIADLPLTGTVRDARAVGDVLFVVRELDGHVALASFELPSLKPRDERVFLGSGAALTASLSRLALAYRAARESTALVLVDWGDEVTGDLSASRTVIVRGVLPEGAGDFGTSAGMALDEETIRVLTCASAACAPTVPMLVSTVALDAARGPAVVAELAVPAVEGPLVARFAAEHLFIAQAAGVEALGPTALRIVDFADPRAPRDAGLVAVDAVIANVVAWGDRVFVLGTRTAPSTGMQVVLREIDTPQRRVIGGMVLGDATAFTPAQHDVRAMALDPGEGALGIPFSSWDDRARRERSYVEIVRTARGPLTSARVPAPGAIDRIVPIQDRFVILGELGARSLEIRAGAWNVESAP